MIMKGLGQISLRLLQSSNTKAKLLFLQLLCRKLKWLGEDITSRFSLFDVVKLGACIKAVMLSKPVGWL